MFHTTEPRYDDAPKGVGGAMSGHLTPVSRSIPEALGALSGAQNLLEERLTELYQRLDAAGVLRDGGPVNTRAAEVSKDVPQPCALAMGIEGMRRRTLSQADAVSSLLARLEV